MSTPETHTGKHSPGRHHAGKHHSDSHAAIDSAQQAAASTFSRSVDSLARAIDYGRGRVPEVVLAEAAETLECLRHRRELSSEHTVIGFFGATGSGKSTLFNTIAGQDIARSAPTRPTTSTVQAAIWDAEGSEALLDWLGIEQRVYPQRQDPLQHETGQSEQKGLESRGEESSPGAELKGRNAEPRTERPPAPNEVVEPVPGLVNRMRRAFGHGRTQTRRGGLILLDMPDFDSVTTANRELAARMMRYVDVLVWVVDPQKYADAVIHRDFMVPLAASGAQTLCVLNQADRLEPSEVPAVLSSLTALMRAEGTDRHLLAEPLAVSARTGEGIDRLRTLLAQVAAAKSASLQSTDAQLYATAARLGEYAGGEGAVLAGVYAAEAERKLVQAYYESSQAGQVLEAATASYRRSARQQTGWIATRWLSRFRADPLRRLHLGTGVSGAERGAGGEQLEVRSTSALLGNPTGTDSSGVKGESAPELVASSLPPLSAAQRAGMANAARHYGAQMAHRVEEPWKRSLREEALSREADLPELLERDLARVNYTAGHLRAPWMLFNALQWLALLSALVGVGWLTTIAGLRYLQIQLPPAPTPEGFPVPLPTLLVVLGVLLGIAAAGVGRALTGLGARYYARKLRARLRAGVENAVRECVVAPVHREAKRLEAYRKALDLRSS